MLEATLEADARRDPRGRSRPADSPLQPPLPRDVRLHRARRSTRGDVDARHRADRRRSSRMPDGALAASRELWADPSAVHLDVLRFKDGRVIERFVAPLIDRIAHRRPDRQLPRHQRRGPHRRGAGAAPDVPRAGAGSRRTSAAGWPSSTDSDRLGWSAEIAPHLRRAARPVRGIVGGVLRVRAPGRSRRGARGQRRGDADGPAVRHRASRRAPGRRRCAGCTRRPASSATRRGARCGWSARCRTSPSGACSRISCGSRRRWRRSAGSPAASRTI